MTFTLSFAIHIHDFGSGFLSFPNLAIAAIDR
jgi:hypothetical protein